jgi:hypothetical protein
MIFPSFKSGVIGFSPGKAGKRMVNIDDFIFVSEIKLGVMIACHVTGQTIKLISCFSGNSICCFSPDSLLSLVKGTWKNGILN